jgi:hypothetical protein
MYSEGSHDVCNMEASEEGDDEPYHPPVMAFNCKFTVAWLMDLVKHIISTPVIVAVIVGGIISNIPLLANLFTGPSNGPFSPPLGFISQMLLTLSG